MKRFFHGDAEGVRPDPAGSASDQPICASSQSATARLFRALEQADTVIIGAGAGLSTAAGFTYTGERFTKYFSDFREKYGFSDMYTGGFYPYGSLEEHWAYWSRYIWVNRYMDPPKPVYRQLEQLVEKKEYFVITTNVDHCFQKAGFPRERLFYTQGDYGLFQCSEPCHAAVYDNRETIRAMLTAQRFSFDADDRLLPPKDSEPKMRIPSALIPCCPRCGRPMSMNLRADDTFVEDALWHRAADRYSLFLRQHGHARILFLELGVGHNTPGIIKYPFWQMTLQNPNAVYACLNFGQAAAPAEIADRSVCINGDIADILQDLLRMPCANA